jgi:hypothetical protein
MSEKVGGQVTADDIADVIFAIGNDTIVEVPSSEDDSTDSQLAASNVAKPGREGQRVTPLIHKKSIVKWMIEEAERTGTEKNVKSKAVR